MADEAEAGRRPDGPVAEPLQGIHVLKRENAGPKRPVSGPRDGIGWLPRRPDARPGGLASRHGRGGDGGCPKAACWETPGHQRGPGSARASPRGLRAVFPDGPGSLPRHFHSPDGFGRHGATGVGMTSDR